MNTQMERYVVMGLVRVLVVDDAEDWRRWTSSRLKVDSSFEIAGEAVDGVQAVKMAQELQPEIILLDIGLPRLNGIQAGGWIRQVAPAAKIIFVSQQFDVEIVDAAMQIGASGFVLKSDAAEALMDAIRAALRDDRFMSRAVVRSLFRNKFKE